MQERKDMEMRGHDLQLRQQMVQWGRNRDKRTEADKS